MSGWFTIEEIDSSTYAISENGHWERMHSYLLIGKTHALLIDTGLGIGNIKTEVDLLTDLPVKVVTTHVHWDHIGGHGLFNDISVHIDDSEWMKSGIPIPINAIRDSVIQKHFSKTSPKDFDINKYNVYKGNLTNLLIDNQVIDIGTRKIKVLHTPGHNDLNVPIYTIKKVKEAFEYLGKSILLVQGSGIFKFKSFSIHI